MNMGDVFAIFGALLAIGIALPGLLLAWSLLFNSTVERARVRLQYTPWRCFWFGVAGLALGALPILILFNIPGGIFRLFGSIGIFLLLTFASLGASGLASLMGDRLRGGGVAVSRSGALLRGAVALELAAAFPLVGWFAVIPIAAICSLGAAGFALLHWAPRPAEPPPMVAQQPPILGSQSAQ